MNVESQLLFLKSRYMAVDQPGYHEQRAFDDALIGVKLFDFSEYGPSADVFTSAMDEAGYSISGFTLKKVETKK
jgi:hypothetical protein